MTSVIREKPRYCIICKELTLKHYKPLLKERDKWMVQEYGYVRNQSWEGSETTRLDKYIPEEPSII